MKDSPLKNIHPEKYSSWKIFTLNIYLAGKVFTPVLVFHVHVHHICVHNAMSQYGVWRDIGMIIRPKRRLAGNSKTGKLLESSRKEGHQSGVANISDAPKKNIYPQIFTPKRNYLWKIFTSEKYSPLKIFTLKIFTPKNFQYKKYQILKNIHPWKTFIFENIHP